jgi:ribosomal protein S6--L-glutamate ligase
MILSFHPLIEADKNIICAGREPSEKDLLAIKSANAVILPQGCRQSLYMMARQHCQHVFPNFDAMFQFPGKTGQTRLFHKYGVPHPETIPFDCVDDWINAKNITSHFPCVFKFSWGGEGHTVFYLESKDQLYNMIDRAKYYEQTGQFGFIIQKYIPCNGRSLRIVIINRSLFAYWRVQSDSFYSNIAQGATIDHESDPHLIILAKRSVMNFCEKTHINLAGFDFLFHENNNIPLFLEINYFFGRKGLGGAEAYYELLVSGVKDWLKMVDTKHSVKNKKNI